MSCKAMLCVLIHTYSVKQILPVKYVLIKQITDLPFVGRFGFRSLIFSSMLSGRRFS